MKLFPMVLFFVLQISFGQNISVILVDKTPLVADEYIGTDDYGNIYFIKENILYKKGANKTYQFSDLQLGKLSSVDIINPLKITLFYKDMNTVVFLDRHLIEIDRIRFNRVRNFRTLGFARTASNNNLWIFNVGAQSLEIYNYLKKEVVADSQPVSSQIIDQDCNFNFCWILLENGLECYNSYGTLVARIPGTKFDALVENNGLLVGKKEERLFFLGKNRSDQVPLNISETGIKQFFLNDEKLYLYNGEFIHTYQLNLTN